MTELRLGFDGNEKQYEVRLSDDQPRPWDRTTKFAAVGRDHPRLDAVDKVTGRAKYSYDQQPAGLIYARMLRSPHASANIKSVDLAAAKAMKGVLFTESYAGETVRYAGAPVAGVAAVTEEVLDDALAAIKVEYEVLPCVVTIEDAQAPGTPVVLNRMRNNVRADRSRGNAEEVQQAHANADAVVEAEYRTQVQTHSCLEPHGTVCHWDGEKLTVWASTQATFAFRGTIARSVGLPESKVEVITEHMGGGFGSKFGADRWDVFCARAARETKRPCRLLLERNAEHMIAGNRPNSIQRCRFSAKKDGTLMGAEVRSWGTGGVSPGGAGVYNPAIYKFAAQYKEHENVVTHAGRGRAFRAPQHPQGVFALEGMMDELAEAIGMDPLAFRLKNDPHPVRRAQWQRGAKEIGWERRKKSGSDKGPIKRGFGCAAARWGHNSRPGSSVRCRVGKDGQVLVANGAQDLGTGTRTVLAILVAEELGLKPAEIEVRLGHTSDPVGPPSGGSQTTPSIAPAARRAGWLAKREVLNAVAPALGGDPKTMNLVGGKVVGGKKEVTFKQACAMLQTDAVDVMGGPREVSDYSVPSFTSEVAGCQFAEVEVDTETGIVKVVKVVAVQDCGVVVDPLLARSQINGAVIQGVSYALFENRVLDRKTGNMLNPNFLDYKIAGAMDIPEIVAIAFSVHQGKTSTGASSLGEPPAVPTPGAIANAVANAIGARVRSLPITPDKVLTALGAL